MFIQQEQYEKAEVVEKYKNFKGLRSEEIKIVEKYFNKNQKILDVGCGAGRTTIDLHNRGYNVIGVDLSSAFMKVAKEIKPEAKWAQIDATKMGVKERAFDVTMFSYNGLGGIVPYAARMEAVREMVRVTKPGGLVLFSSRPMLHKIFSRFQKKSFFSALKSNLSDVKVNLTRNFPLCLYGYNLHQTDYEWANLYMSTTWNINKKTMADNPELTLLEMIGNRPHKSIWDLNVNSHMIYYIYRKK